MDKPTRQKVNKKMLQLNLALEQMDLAGVLRTSHPTAAEYTFSGINHILGHKSANLRELKSYQLSSLTTIL